MGELRNGVFFRVVFFFWLVEFDFFKFCMVIEYLFDYIFVLGGRYVFLGFWKILNGIIVVFKSVYDESISFEFG